MEDGYLERHYEEYEKRKTEWLKKKKNYGRTTKTNPKG
ncbi:MAG: dehydrogenase [Paludibacteraceae bacterium]|nr:dehydrogenase [Paludibacteraceae bacterium]